jgi:exopolysaccharide production protein ExoQ
MTAIANSARTWILCLGFALFVPLGLLAKQSMATSFIATAVLLLLASGLSNPKSLAPSKPLALAFAGFAGYVAITHLFFVDCEICTTKAAGKLAMLALVLWVSASGIAAVEPDVRRKVGMALTFGLVFALILLVFELSTDSSFYRMLSGRQIDPDVPLFRYNRGTTAVVLLVWPAAAWAWAQERRGTAVGLIAISIAAAAYGDSASALVAGLLATLTAALAALAPSFALSLCLLVAGAFTAAAPWLLINLLGWIKPFADSLPPSVLDRIEIWNHGAKAVFEAPVLGQGIGIIRHLPVPDSAISGYRFLVKPPTHPHDAALQVWLELGGIGVALFGVLVWLATRGLGTLEAPWRAAGIASVAAIIFTAMVSYGLWQETWLGIIGMTALAFRALAPAPFAGWKEVGR